MKRVISMWAAVFSLATAAMAAAEEPVLRVEPLVQEAIAKNRKSSPPAKDTPR